MTILERMLDEMDKQSKRAVDLTRILDINSSVFSTWKKFNRNPPAEYLCRICEFLGVSIEWILTGNCEKLPQPKNVVSMWELQEYQRHAIEKYFDNLTEDQALLLDNYGKLTQPNQVEVQSIITMKITMQAMGRTELESGTA